jgi:hypothetical protein
MPSKILDETSEGVYFVTGTLTTSATALGSATQNLTELVIQASPSNAVNIVIGDAASQGWVLVPGDEFNCPVKNPALIFGKAASSTATYSLFGRVGS